MVEQRIFLQDIIYDGEDYSVRKSVSLTRAEAIERIAKAQFNFMWQNKYSWENVEDEDKKSFYKSAEAALNALLEGGK